jgi:hypothetical protein
MLAATRPEAPSEYLEPPNLNSISRAANSVIPLTVLLSVALQRRGARTERFTQTLRSTVKAERIEGRRELGDGTHEKAKVRTGGFRSLRWI